jgi:hypothetical protein
MNDDLWRNRFAILTLARLGGLAIFLLGIAIIYTDLLREGGWPLVGAILAIMGAIDATFAPKLLKREWDRADAERGRRDR